jgi:hypothetical protein
VTVSYLLSRKFSSPSIESKEEQFPEFLKISSFGNIPSFEKLSSLSLS